MLASEILWSSLRSDQVLVRRGSRVFAPEIWSENVAYLGDPAVRCLSVASFGSRDVFAANLAIVTHGANVGVAFFRLPFLGEARKVTALRHEQLLALRPSFDKLTTNGNLRFAGTTSTLTCPPGILSRTRARQTLALRVDYALDPRFARMTAVEGGGELGLWGHAPGEHALATAKYVHASFN